MNLINEGITRRALLAAAAAAGGSSTTVLAQPANSSSTGTVRTDSSPLDQRPYIELAPPISEDLQKVLTFFSFSCPFCRLQHDAIANWATGLPTKYLQHEFVPVVTDKQTMTAAIIYYAARRQYPKPRDLQAFMGRAYMAIQDGNKSMTDPKTWVPLLARPFAANDHKTDVIAAAKRLVDYQITNTPSIAMAGRYVITPEIVNGRTDTFIQLANGVASMALSSMGYTGR